MCNYLQTILYACLSSLSLKRGGKSTHEVHSKHRGDRSWTTWVNGNLECVLSVDSDHENNTDQAALCFPGNSKCFTVTEDDMEPGGKWEKEILSQIIFAKWNLGSAWGFSYLNVHPDSPVKGRDNMEAVISAISSAVPRVHLIVDQEISQEVVRSVSEKHVNAALDALEKTLLYCSFRGWELNPKVWLAYDVSYPGNNVQWKDVEVDWHVYGSVRTNKGVQIFDIQRPLRETELPTALNEQEIDIDHLLEMYTRNKKLLSMMIAFGMGRKAKPSSACQIAKLSPETILRIGKHLLKML